MCFMPENTRALSKLLNHMSKLKDFALIFFSDFEFWGFIATRFS